MNKHSQKLDSLQSLLEPPAPPPPLSPMARLLMAMRVVKADPIVKQLRQRRSAWMSRKLSRFVAETIAVETQDAPELGRKLCHWVMRPKGKRPGSRRSGPHLGSAYCDAVYAAALKAVETAKKMGSRRALRSLSHLDEEFAAAGIPLPKTTGYFSPAERVTAVLEPKNEEDLLDIKPEDFLFDARECKWYQQDARGDWMGHYTDTGFTIRLFKLKLPRKAHDGFKAKVPQYDRAEPLFDTASDLVMRHGAGVRNTYVKPVLVPEPGAWPDIYRVLLNLVRGNGDHLAFLLDWLAAPLQALHRNGKPLKMGTAIVLHGDEGSGKGTLERIVNHLYGSGNVAVLGQNALESRFHEQLVDKLFVVANEVISSTNRSAETQNLLKPWVTDDEIPLEAKHKAATKTPNRFNIIFTSNDEKPVIVPKKDRRYTVFKTGPRLPGTLSEAVYADLDGPQLQVAAFYWHLLHRKVQVKVGQVLDTEARREVQAATASSDEKFVAALKQEGWFALCAPWAEAQRRKRPDDAFTMEENTNEGYAVLASRLNEVYKDFCDRQNLKPRDQAQLGKTLKAEVPGARSKEKKLGRVPFRMWFGLPMMPPEMEADIIPLPTAQQAPVEGTKRPAESAVDDADFGTDAA